MKKYFVMLLLTAAAMLMAENAPATPATNAECPNQLQPLSKWTAFQAGILPGIPGSMANSNVMGIKSGWPVCCGIGRVYGVEVSWIYSGTSHIKGIQASWICNHSDTLDGIQAAFVTSLNLNGPLRGLQATMGYAQTCDLYGAQGGAVVLADNVKGIQAGLVLAIAKDVQGFQASGVSIATGRLQGVQCNIYGQVADSSGVQLGAVNVSGGKGLQFGAINIMKNGFLPVFPIFNFGF